MIDYTNAKEISEEQKRLLDAINSEIKGLEDFLNDSVFKQVSVSLLCGQTDVLKWEESSVFGRWRIFYLSTEKEEPAKPLVECKAQIRIRMMYYFQRFLDEVVKVYELEKMGNYNGKQ